MPKFQVRGKGNGGVDEIIELEMPTVEMVINTVSAFWVDFDGQAPCPFDVATVSTGGQIVADGWREPNGWMWDDIVEDDEDPRAYADGDTRGVQYGNGNTQVNHF